MEERHSDIINKKVFQRQRLFMFVRLTSCVGGWKSIEVSACLLPY